RPVPELADGPGRPVPELADGPGRPVPELADGLSGSGWQPPYSLGLSPDGHLVIGIAAAAIVLGAIGLAAGLLSVRRMPPARHLLIAGCLAAGVLAFLPPSGSSDHLNYAAYGRIAALGHDPYVTVPADLPADPVAGAVEEWRSTPSVYGPVATAVQALASHLGGDSVRLTVFVLALVNAAAFIATGLLLHRLTRDDPVRQRRAALLWTANPLLVYHLVAGMHLDTLAIAPVVAAMLALVAMRNRRALAVPLAVPLGVALGAGIAVKVTTGLVALGPAWELRRRPARLALVAGSALATVSAAYWAAGPHALDRVRDASRTVSLATPWKLVKQALQAVFGSGAYHIWIQAGSLLLLAVLAVLLLRSLGRGDPGAGPMVALIFVVAWLFATPYALPWYDGLAFALLALVRASWLDAFLVARLAVLSLGYLPARQRDQPPDLGWLVDVVRSQVVPAILLVLTIGLLALAWVTARRRRAGVPGRTRPV
ncbi:polyprenol phosphomannose-dependent alpha 1,6 mannosyltransferase MptB, partial [Sphaerimonospora thailandensis]|uniref:polyprenol phosphomannose-dependent alpha 1,6 mannosyltransferase MptB n=1 Tax=Sphaerimonospora thailandensis TaxID=795644 RepID=UPI00194E87C4